MSKAMRQMPEQSGRVVQARGEAARETISDEADGPLFEHPDTGLAKPKVSTGGLLEAALTRAEPASGPQTGQGQQRRSRGGWARYRADH